MKSILIFLSACAALVLVAWIVSKITGSHAWMLEDWKFNDGEVVVWRDDAADVGMIPKAGQAVVMTPARLHRSSVVVTNQRILIGMKTLGGDRHMVQYVLYPGSAPGGDSKRLDGGLLTTGYSTLVIQPDVMAPHLDGKYPYVELTPAPAEPSSTNLAEVRIFTDNPASFRLP